MAMMISKFHRIIQSKIVWGAFAVLISVAFVGITAPGSKSRSQAKREQRASEQAGRLFGEEVSRIEFARAYHSSRLFFTLRNGPFQITDEIDALLIDQAWKRIATLKKAKQLGLEATPEQVVRRIQSEDIFINPNTGQFDPNIYQAALPQIQTLTGMGPKDVENFYAEEVLRGKVNRIPAQGALVTDREIMKAFHLYTDKRTVEYAAIPRDLAKAPKITEEEALQYYNNNPDEFRYPEKVLVEYVSFPVADELEGISVPDELVARFYENNKARYLIESEEGVDIAAPPQYQPLEEVRGSIEELLREQRAIRVAAGKADELVSLLATEALSFRVAAEQSGLKVIGNTPAFSRTDAVKGIDPSAPFQQAAFGLELNDTHYFSDPVIGREAVYVIGLKKKLDAFVPAFDIVRDSVFAAAEIAAAEQAYTDKSMAIYSEVSQALSGGSSFADALNSYKLEVTTTEPFDIGTTLMDEIGEEIKNSAVFYDKGSLTDLIATQDGFVLAYVSDLIPGDEEATLPAMRRELVRSLGNAKGIQLINAWQKSLLEEGGLEDLRNVSEDES